ncbi:MAG TPA: GNAT family N-acetyltransferase [Thermoanaerobaculia bacterium]
MSNHVRHNEEESRFETVIDGRTAFVDYRRNEGEIVLTHTEVPPELSGRGLANEIVKQALEYARANDLRVVPQCSFVQKYIERNPEYADLASAS